MADSGINVRIGAREEVSGASKKAVKAIRGLGDQSKKTGKAILQTWSQATIVIAGVTRAWSALSDRVTELVDLYGEQENAENKLRRAVENNPLLNGDGARRLADYASEMQTVSRFGDEALIAQQSFIASLGYSEQQIRDITLAAVELASTGQMSLEGAFRNTAKTLSGMTGELGELLPGIRDLSKEALQAGGAIEYIINQFEGMKEAGIEGIEGFRAQVSNLGGDIKEKLGKIIVEVFEGSGGRGILDYLEKIDEWLADNELYIVAMFQSIPELADAAFSAVQDMLQEAFSFQTVIDSWKTGLGLLGDLAKNELGYTVNLGRSIFNRDYTEEDAKNEYLGGFVEALLNWLDNAPLDFSDRLDQAFDEMDAVIRKREAVLSAQSEDTTPATSGGVSETERRLAFNIAEWRFHADRTSKPNLNTILKQQLPTWGFQGTALQSIMNAPSIMSRPTNYGVPGQTLVGDSALSLMDTLMVRLGSIVDTFKTATETAATNMRRGTTIGAGLADTRIGRGIGSDAVGFGGNALLNAFQNVIGKVTGFFKELGSGIMDAVSGFASIVALMNPVQTIIAAAVKVLAPIVNDLLSPLVGILAILGQTIGQMLQPALEALEPVISFLAEAFTWLYNKAIVPLGNGVSEILLQITTTISWMVQKIQTAINNLLVKLPLIGNDRELQTYDLSLQEAMDAAFANGAANPLSEINLTDLDAAGQEYMGATGGGFTGGGGVGSSTTVQRQPDINVYISADSVNGSGGMAEFGRMVADAIVEYTNVGGRVEFLEA